MGDRAQAGGRGGQADPLAQSFRHLLAPLFRGYTPMINSIYNGLRMRMDRTDNETKLGRR